MKLHKRIPTANGAGHPAPARARCWTWALLSLAWVLLSMVATAASAASFSTNFLSQPPGVPETMQEDAGVPAFNITLGGQAFTFSASGGAFGWQRNFGLYLLNSTPQVTIRRQDGGAFLLNTLGFDGRFGPMDNVVVQVLRNGANAAATRTVLPVQPQQLVYPSVEVDEIRLSSPDIFYLGFNLFAGDSEAVAPAPSITSLSPSSGPTSGSTTVGITGTGFTNVTGVAFGAKQAVYTVNSATQITATAPSGAAGVVDVTVTTSAGTSAITASDRYTYVAAPQANSFTYGTIIAYNNGSNQAASFNLSTMVTNTPTSYAVGSATTAQGGAVSITNAGVVTYTPPVGYRNGNDSFTYTASNAGGTSNVATGTLLIGNPTLQATLVGAGQLGMPLGGVAINVQGGRAPYACSTTTTSGALPAGVVINADCSLSGTPTQSGSFTFATTLIDNSNAPYSASSGSLTLNIAGAPLPVVTSIAPTSGPVAGGTVVNIIGNQFTGVTRVSFGGTPASSVTVNSSTSIIAVAPAGSSGTVDVTVTTTAGTSATSAADQFTYIALPTVTGLSPSSGPSAGGTTVVITGTGFSNATGVTFGSAPALGYTLSNDNQITATAPAGSGMLNVRVTTPAGSSATTPSSQYTYTTAPVAGNVTIGAVAPYNDGRSPVLTFSLSSYVSGSTTGYAVTSATTSLGGTVSVNAVGQVTYIAPVGVRAQNDTFGYTASNAGGTSNVATVTLGIRDPNLSVVLQGAGQLGVPLAGVAIAPSGGRAPYTCATATTAGVLPAGVQINADCSLSGTPSQVGSFSFSTDVTDSSSAPFTTTSGALTLTVGAAAPGAPTIGTATVTGTGAVTVTFTAPASNGGAAITSYTVFASPGGALTTGTGSPLTVTGLTAGTSYTFTVRATNAAGTGAASASSNAVTPVPVLVASPVNANVAYGATATPVTLSINGAPTSVAVVAPPAHGTALASGTGIAYTPAPGYAGPDSFSYSASDAFSTSAAATVSIMVGPPTVTLDQASLPDGSTSAAYSQMLGASGGAAPYTFAITSGALPAGLTLQSNGVLSGRATAAGTFNVTVTATDSSTGAGPFRTSRAYSLVVVAPSVVLDLPALPDAPGAQGYSQQLTASGGTAPYQFALRSGRLPPGLVLSTSGAVSGQPTQAGTFVFDVQATDANGFIGNRAYTFVVQSALQVITALVATPEAPVYSAGGTFSVSATGGASGQPVVFASASPAVCSVQGTTVTMVTAGNCVLTADQAGDALYAAAAQARLQVLVAAATPVISWVTDMSRVYGEDAFELPSPQSTSPGGFTFTSSNPAVATISGRTVTLQGEGSTTLIATQAAGGGYAAAAVQVTLVVAARPDPTTDQTVVGSLQAQVDATVRFAQVQQANIRERLRQVRMGSNASSSNLVLAYAGGNGKQGLSLPLRQSPGEAPALPQGWGVWAAGTLSFGSSGHGRTSADFNTGGITVGADRAIGENLLWGVAGSWGRQDTEFDDNPSTTDADQRSLALYGLWRAGEHLFVDAMLASGRLDFTMNRWSAPANAAAHSTRGGTQWFGSVTFGYEHRTVGGTTLATYGRYDGHKARLDPYREHGLGVYDLSYGRQDVETSALAVGLEGSHAFRTDRLAWRPYWTLEYRTALDDRSDATMNYVQRPAARDYLLAMHSYNDDTLSVGAGVDLQFSSGWMLSLLIGHDQGRNTLRSNSMGIQVRYGGQPTGGAVRSRPSGNDHLGASDAQPACSVGLPGCTPRQAQGIPAAAR